MLLVAIMEVKERCERYRKPRHALDPSILDNASESLLIIPSTDHTPTSPNEPSRDQQQLDDLSGLLDAPVTLEESPLSEQVNRSRNSSRPSDHLSLSLFNSPGHSTVVNSDRNGVGDDFLSDLLDGPVNSRVNSNPEEERPNPLLTFRVREGSMFASRMQPPQYKNSERSNVHFSIDI